jgi:uncharacterized protein YyaL (SSP411 family)
LLISCLDRGFPRIQRGARVGFLPAAKIISVSSAESVKISGADKKEQNNMKHLFYILLISFAIFSCQADGPRHTNALIDESSPYLLQHAHNPVDWYPWKEEALQKAVEEDKLLLISIGYAACHWCHVMEEESFQDTAVANLMNRHFINIKVDREERPDVDDVYMTACQMAGGESCGWPLNAIALPDGRPIWAGTYFPKKQWLDILKYFVEIQVTEADKLEAYADRLVDGLAAVESIPIPATETELDAEKAQSMADTLLSMIDFEKGGLRGNIKFPMPTTFEFLLEYHHIFGTEKALEAVNTTLKKMALGGLYDQLGGGFARYSTDPDWQVPHFEKMLYDNGQLLSLYAHAYQITKDPLFEKVVRSTIAFAERELSHPQGAFFSSINADSEGEEGTFYVWTQEEIQNLIPDETSQKLVIDHFGVQAGGNWEDEKNVLAVQYTVQELAETSPLSESEIRRRLEEAKAQLFEVREQRTRPSLDDKVLTSWNALMISGYLDAYQALGEPDYLERALQAAAFLSEHMLKPDGRLDRNFKDGQSSINAFLDDYALSMQAFLDVYQQTFDGQWLEKATLLKNYVLDHFQDEDSPLLFYTSDEDPPLVSRKKIIEDNVIASSNSVMARNFYHLGILRYDTSLVNKSKQMLSLIAAEIASEAVYFSNWGSLYLEQLFPPYEVVIIGPDYAARRDSLLSHFLPNALFLGGPEENELPLLKNKFRKGKTMIYVCKDKVCKLPVETVRRAMDQIK